jgi:hypothetical protein
MAGDLLMLRTTWLLMVLTLLLTGCAPLQSTDSNADRLQEQIRSGEAIAAGDKVCITTHNGVERCLSVSAVDDDYVHGYADSRESDDLPQSMPDDEVPDVEVAIEDIVRIDSLEASSTATGDFRNVLSLIFLGVGMIIANFANF